MQLNPFLRYNKTPRQIFEAARFPPAVVDVSLQVFLTRDNLLC